MRQRPSICCSARRAGVLAMLDPSRPLPVGRPDVVHLWAALLDVQAGASEPDDSRREQDARSRSVAPRSGDGALGRPAPRERTARRDSPRVRSACRIRALPLRSADLPAAATVVFNRAATITMIPGSDGDSLATFFLPNPQAALTILYAHGNAEDLGQVATMLEEMQRNGFAVLGFDYRGYGMEHRRLADHLRRNTRHGIGLRIRHSHARRASLSPRAVRPLRRWRAGDQSRGATAIRWPRAGEHLHQRIRRHGTTPCSPSTVFPTCGTSGRCTVRCSSFPARTTR